MSESDYPFEVFSWESENKENITPELILKRIERSLDTPIEVVDLDSFFELATAEQAWHSSEDKETVKRYQALIKILKDNLSDIQVVRLGKITIDVYIIGKTSDGDLAGLSTKLVET